MPSRFSSKCPVLFDSTTVPRDKHERVKQKSPVEIGENTEGPTEAESDRKRGNGSKKRAKGPHNTLTYRLSLPSLPPHPRPRLSPLVMANAATTLEIWIHRRLLPSPSPQQQVPLPGEISHSSSCTLLFSGRISHILILFCSQGRFYFPTCTLLLLSTLHTSMVLQYFFFVCQPIQYHCWCLFIVNHGCSSKPLTKHLLLMLLNLFQILR